MEYKALVSFSGAISMSMGEVREIEDPAIVNDLLKAGYIQPNVGSEPRPSAVIDKSKIVDNEPPSEANKEVHDNQPKPSKAGGETKHSPAADQSKLADNELPAISGEAAGSKKVKKKGGKTNK